jgi:transcriptional regulator with XRE-family HTH domain
MKQQQLMKQIIDRANELGLDYKDVAKLCGMNFTTVWRNFKGETIPSSDTILKYISGLDFQIILG